MLRAIQVQNFRMLAQNYLRLESSFHVLVGQNATGKSTFLSAINLVSSVLRHGAKRALLDISPNFFDLCFEPGRPSVAIAIELDVPAPPVAATGRLVRDEAPEVDQAVVPLRYELELGPDEHGKLGLRVLRENLFQLPRQLEGLPSLSGPEAARYPLMHTHAAPPRSWQPLLAKGSDGRAHFYSKSGLVETWRPQLDQSAFGVLPAEDGDDDEYPLARLAQQLLAEGPQLLALDVSRMREAVPPMQESRLQLSGANLPHVVRAFRERDPILFDLWVKHVALAVQGLESIDVIERPEDRHLYIVGRFAGAHHQPVPAWLMSDGTLRLLALTLLGFAAEPDQPRFYMIEQPEDGLHPLAMETVFTSLSDPPPGTQVFLATHSPVFLAQVAIEQTLVFRRALEGYSIICHGTEIPELRDWHGRTNMAHLLASGVLS